MAANTGRRAAGALISKLKRGIRIHPDKVDAEPDLVYRNPAPASQPERIYSPSFPEKTEELSDTGFHYAKRGSGVNNGLRVIRFVIPPNGEPLTPEQLAQIPTAALRAELTSTSPFAHEDGSPKYPNKPRGTLAPDLPAIVHDE